MSLLCYKSCARHSLHEHVTTQSLKNFARPLEGQQHEMPRPRNSSWINMYKEFSIYL